MRGRPITSHDAAATIVWLAWAAASALLFGAAARASGGDGNNSTADHPPGKVMA